MPNIAFMSKKFTLDEFLTHLCDDATKILNDNTQTFSDIDKQSFQDYITAVQNIMQGLKNVGTGTPGFYKSATEQLKNEQNENEKLKLIANIQDPLIKGIFMLDNGFSAINKGATVPLVNNNGQKAFSALYLLYIDKLHENYNNLNLGRALGTLLWVTGYSKTMKNMIKGWGTELNARLKNFDEAFEKEVKQKRAVPQDPPLEQVEHKVKRETEIVVPEIQMPLAPAVEVEVKVQAENPSDANKILSSNKMLSSEESQSVQKGIKIINEIFSNTDPNKASQTKGGVKQWISSFLFKTPNEIIDEPEKKRLQSLQKFFQAIENITQKSSTPDLNHIRELYEQSALNWDEYSNLSLDLQDVHDRGVRAYNALASQYFQSIKDQFDHFQKNSPRHPEVYLEDILNFQESINHYLKNSLLSDPGLFNNNEKLKILHHQATALTNIIKHEFIHKITQLISDLNNKRGVLYTEEDKLNLSRAKSIMQSLNKFNELHSGDKEIIDLKKQLEATIQEHDLSVNEIEDFIQRIKTMQDNLQKHLSNPLAEVSIKSQISNATILQKELHQLNNVSQDKSLIAITEEYDKVLGDYKSHFEKTFKFTNIAPLIKNLTTQNHTSPIGKIYTQSLKASFSQKLARKDELSFLQKTIDVLKNTNTKKEESAYVLCGIIEYFKKELKPTKTSIGIGKFRKLLSSIEATHQDLFQQLDKQKALNNFKAFIQKHPQDFKDMKYTKKILSIDPNAKLIFSTPLSQSKQELDKISLDIQPPTSPKKQ